MKTPFISAAFLLANSGATVLPGAGEITNVKLVDRADGSGETKVHPGRSSVLVKRIPDQCWPAYYTKFPYTVSNMAQLKSALSVDASGPVSLEAGDTYAWRYDDAMLCVYNLNIGGGLSVTTGEASWAIGYIQSNIPCCPSSYTGCYGGLCTGHGTANKYSYETTVFFVTTWTDPNAKLPPKQLDPPDCPDIDNL